MRGELEYEIVGALLTRIADPRPKIRTMPKEELEQYELVGELLCLADALKWDEGAHPRHPAGSPEGGRFAPAEGASGDSGDGSADRSTRVTPEERQAATAYQESPKRINGALRRGALGQYTARPSVLAQARALSQLINRQPEFSGKVYRGVHGRFAERLIELQPGDIIRDRGFMSTTKNPTIAELHANVEHRGWLRRVVGMPGLPRQTQMPALMTINVMRTKALDVSSVTGKQQTEEEMLLPRRTKLLYTGYDGASHNFVAAGN